VVGEGHLSNRNNSNLSNSSNSRLAGRSIGTKAIKDIIITTTPLEKLRGKSVRLPKMKRKQWIKKKGEGLIVKCKNVRIDVKLIWLYIFFFSYKHAQ
jgi:hypothetical protein